MAAVAVVLVDSATSLPSLRSRAYRGLGCRAFRAFARLVSAYTAEEVEAGDLESRLLGLPEQSPLANSDTESSGVRSETQEDCCSWRLRACTLHPNTKE